jgi:hypothetical protein
MFSSDFFPDLTDWLWAKVLFPSDSLFSLSVYLFFVLALRETFLPMYALCGRSRAHSVTFLREIAGRHLYG